MLCAPVAALLFAVPLGADGTAGASISLDKLGAGYTQNFDTLANSGTSGALPDGWFLSESGANANATYTAGNGSDNAGDTYSFGATGSAERALGGLQSGSLIPTFGAAFTNNTGTTITSVTISYTGEQWRLGTAGRGADRIDFQYSTDATSLTSGTWTDHNPLDFSSPVTTGTVGALDGNAAANRTTISGTIIGLNIPNGTTLWIRWTDFNASGSDDGLAVDEFSLIAAGTVAGSPSATGLADPNPVLAGTATSLSATVTPGSNPPSQSATAACDLRPIGGGAFVTLPVSYVIPQATPPDTYSLMCSVTDDRARSSIFVVSLQVITAPTGVLKIYNISQITGPGTRSPLAGERVVARGIVTGLRPNAGGSRGFYIQSRPADVDDDPNTSEGLLVFTGSATPPPCAVVGNFIEIEGTVQDFASSASPTGSVPLTELSSTANCVVAGTADLPAAVTLDSAVLVPGGPATQARRFLAMRVRLDDAEATGPSLGNLNETTETATPSGVFFVAVPGAGRAFRPQGIQATRRPADAPDTLPNWNNAPEILRIDTTGLAGGKVYEVATGTHVRGITGIMDFNTSQSVYQIYTDANGAGAPSPATPTRNATPVPEPLSNDLTVANFNIQRFYNSTNDGNGAPVIAETAYQGRLNKLSMAVRNVLRMPDILTLEEVEGPRNGAAAPAYPVAQDIVNKINSDASAAGQGNPNYDWCEYPTNDPSLISIAILFKRDKVRLIECVQYGADTLYDTPGGGNETLNDRPPVVMRAEVDTFPVRIVANHLRSFSGIDQPGVTNGERVRAKRNEQAKYLARLLSQWSATENLIVTGDFNSYEVNDGYADTMGCIAGAPAPANEQYVASPCDAIPGLALTNLNEADPDQRYSYIFSGVAQRIDHILVNAALLPRVRLFTYARSNADFPEGPTYRNDFTRPERLSDHDMPIVYVTLPAAQAPF